jgi:hypothetical protein
MARIYDRVSSPEESGAITNAVRYNLFRPTGSVVERKSLEDWLADFNAQIADFNAQIAAAVAQIVANVSIDLELPTTASIATTTIPAQVSRVTTLGYAAVGDGGGATFKIVGSVPGHPGYRTSANGKICEITGLQIDLRALGGVPNGASGTSKQAYLDWINVGVATKIPLYIPPYTFDLGDAYISVSGPVNIRGEGKRSNLKRSVRSGSASFGILLWITSTEAPTFENFQIEYAAGTWPAHPGGIPDADAGANCAIILTNCDGPVMNHVHILGEWYVCFTFQDCDNIKLDQISARRYINRGLYIGSGAKNCINARVNQPVIDGHTADGVTPRADYGININTAAGTAVVDCHIVQPQVSGCTAHAIGISALARFCRVIGGSIYNCFIGALIQEANGFIPQYCSVSDMTIEFTQNPVYFTNAYYCDATGIRVNGSNYQGNAPQYMVRLNGCQYCFVTNCRADNMTIAGVVCDAGGTVSVNSYGHVISNNYIQMTAGTGFSSDSSSGATWWTGNRVIGAVTGFAILGTHPTATNNITT